VFISQMNAAVNRQCKQAEKKERNLLTPTHKRFQITNWIKTRNY